MKAPALKITPSLLSLPEVLQQLCYFSGALIPSMLKFHESLAGKVIDVSSIPKEALVGTLMGAIDSVAVPGIKKLLPEDNGHGRDCDSVTVSGRHCFGARGWYLVVEFQIEFFYTMALDFLDGLRKKKRTVYPIVRDLLALVLRSGKVPGMMPDEIYEWLCPEEDVFDDEEDQKGFTRDREFALSRYEYHIRSVRCVNEKEWRDLLKRAQGRLRRLREKTLTGEQRDFIRSLLKLACLCMVKQYEQLELLQPGNDENGIENSFGVLWNSQDGFSDWYFEAMNDQWGNSGPPRMCIIVRNRNDLVRVRIILRTLLLLQEVWYSHEVLRI